jgi:hypothetical protein
VIVFFLHIPKTAGSTVIQQVGRTLPRKSTVLVHDPHPERLSRRLLRFSNSRQMFFVQAHISPFPGLFDIPMKRVTILRDPLQRLISHFCYSFERRFYDLPQLEFFKTRENYVRSRKFDCEDLIAWVETFKMDDLQVRFLSGDYGRPLTEESESKALDALRSLDFVATTENLTQLFMVLSALMAQTFSLERIPHPTTSNSSTHRFAEGTSGCCAILLNTGT